MRKTVYVIFFILLIATTVYAESFDLRNVNWLMSPDQVKKAEGVEPKTVNKDYLKFETTINNLEFDLKYNFKSDKLVSAFFTTKLDQKPKVNDFTDIVKALKDKYGEPADVSSKEYVKLKGRILVTWKTKRSFIQAAYLMAGNCMISIIQQDINDYKEMTKEMDENQEQKSKENGSKL